MFFGGGLVGGKIRAGERHADGEKGGRDRALFPRQQVFPQKT